jgi:uncharacterized protein YndB with AHSA1/START domain
MLSVISLVAAVAIIVVLALAATKPNQFRVERRMLIKAPAEKIFPYLSDPRKTVLWSPWEKKDPNLKKTFTGAASGKGAIYEWDGNKEIGAGRLEITESVAPKKVVMDLRFLRPMKADNFASYEIGPADGGCEVAWAIWGPSPFMSKVMCLFIDMDKMIGREFEKGLADLKALAEA